MLPQKTCKKVPRRILCLYNHKNIGLQLSEKTDLTFGDRYLCYISLESCRANSEIFPNCGSGNFDVPVVSASCKPFCIAVNHKLFFSFLQVRLFGRARHRLLHILN